MAEPIAAALARAPHARFALFDHHGFRPFFLLAGLYAVVVLAAWLAFLHGALPESGAWPALRWHAHEMLFGFVSAAVAGFLLTAVPNWTGRRGYAGAPLVLLVAIWIAGRVAVNPAVPVPGWVAALADLAFFPALVAVILPSLVRAKNPRNWIFVLVLSLLAAANALHHLDILGLATDSWRIGTRLAVNLVLLLVAVMGGRIVPSFTANALKRRGDPRGIVARPVLDRAALAALALVLLLDLVGPETTLAGLAAAAAAALHALRVLRWRGHTAWREPILWILHIAYGWLPLGLALKAAWLLGDWPAGANWLHALTIGGFATMILAVMSRAALGHTGRPLVAAAPTVAAYAALTLAALVRVFGPALWPDASLTLVGAAGALWILAFGLFVIVYAPILAGARADSRPR